MVAAERDMASSLKMEEDGVQGADASASLLDGDLVQLVQHLLAKSLR